VYGWFGVLPHEFGDAPPQVRFFIEQAAQYRYEQLTQD
jgi:hypothetical protein